MTGRPGAPGSFTRQDSQVRFPSSARTSSASLPLAKAHHVPQIPGVEKWTPASGWEKLQSHVAKNVWPFCMPLVP